MKKFTYLATMLLVMAGAVSCEKKAEVKEPTPQPTGVMRQVTISAGQAAEKTSVYKGNLTWSDGDKLNIVPTAGEFEAVALEMASEPGGASATFQGSIDSAIEDNTPLYGWAGGNWTYNSGIFTIEMPDAQTYVENGLAEDAYPSIGTGTINDGISLSNPFGVLRIDVKVELVGSVKSIVLESASKNLAGTFTVNPNNGFAVSEGSSKAVTLSCENAVALSTDGVTFRIVIPAGEYAANDLTATLKDENGAVLLDATWADATEVEQGKSTTKFIIGRGIAKRTDDIDVNWVQLWENGPKWAEYNVGEDNGDGSYGCGGYFAWKGNETRGSKETVNDTATALWGSNWRMPTSEELQALIDNCDVEWTDNYNSTGKAGNVYKGQGEYSGNSVFFPAAGNYHTSGILINTGIVGYYWSSTPDGSDSAYDLIFISGNQAVGSFDCGYGYSVRAVLME